MIEPRYDHDCIECTFVGHMGDDDVYVCEQGGFMPTIIRRYGHGGPEYESGLGLMYTLSPDLRRKARGVLGMP